MSVQQPLNAELVEQARQQIRAIVGEIAQIAKLDITPDEFHREFLHRVVSAITALGGAFWTVRNDTPTLSYHIQISELGFDLSDQNANSAARKHARLIQKMFHGPDAGTLIPPQSGVESGVVANESLGNPGDKLLLFCPIRTELEVVGLVEVIQRPDVPLTTQQGFLRFLSQVCALATDYYKNQQLRHFSDRQNLWGQLEQFTRTIHQSLDTRATAYTLVNEGRRLIECDRVSLALCRGKRCKVLAVSGQDTVDKRATAIRLLNKLATAVAQAGEPLWYSGDTTDFAPQIEQAVEKYVDESHSKMIAAFPLARQKKQDSETQDAKKRHRHARPNKPFAVLLVEQIEDSHISERLQNRIGIVAEHAQSALRNALEHQSVFLMPVWKKLGQSKILFSVRMLPKTVVVLACLIALISLLLFYPKKFLMSGNATLEPVTRQMVFAPLDAEIEELRVNHGIFVRGPFMQDGEEYVTPLATLRSSELENQKIQLQGENNEIRAQLASLKLQQADPDKQLKEADRTELVGKIQQAEIRLKSNEERYAVYLKQLAELTVVAPIDGTVITPNLAEKLTKKRPVSRMQSLMEIADLQGEWQLEVAMPEKRMGHIMDHWNALRKKDPTAKMRVEFIMASNPDEKYFGTIMEDGIHDRAEVRGDQGSAAASSSGMNTVLIKVALDDDPKKLPRALRPGVECVAKIDCGTRPLGYVLFHEAIAFIQKNVLFRWF